MKKIKVAIVNSSYRNVYSSICQIMDLLEYVPKKEGIFIKPNLVDMIHPRKAVTTHPKFIEGIIRYFKIHYPEKELVVGDGCAINMDYDAILKKTGLIKLRKKYQFKIVNLDTVERKNVKFGGKKIPLPKLLDTHEYINVPKMKTHLQTSVSLGAKNQKGLLNDKTKKKFHRDFDLHKSIKLLSEIVKPDLTITDGILSLEGDGPTDTGEPKKTKLVIASRDIHAHDTVAALCMGFDPKGIKHLTVKSNYEITGEDLSKSIKPHLKPRNDFIRVANFYLSVTDSMCTQCAITFKNLLDLKIKNIPFLFKVFVHGGFKDSKYILLGKQAGTTYDINNTIGFGSCTLKRNPKIMSVKGCPPSIEEMQNSFIDFLSKKTVS